MLLRIHASSPSTSSHVTPTKVKSDVGLVGLSTMGKNLVFNLAENGYQVSVYNRSHNKTLACIHESTTQGLQEFVHGHDTLQTFVHSLGTPRKIILLVKAGAPVDEIIQSLVEYLEEGDIVIDAGNEWYKKTEAREKELEKIGVEYIGMGISGGAEGARFGPSIMSGGKSEAYEIIRPMVESIAAKECQGGCALRVGPGGSGNYVKMVHNGIEYGIMQCMSEVFDIMKVVYGLDSTEIARVFDIWNQGELRGFLTEITSKVCAEKDPLDESSLLVDKILGKGGMKGTGTWTVKEALSIGIPVPTISAAVDARVMSSLDRKESHQKRVCKNDHILSWDKQAETELRHALYASILMCYVQGLHVLSKKSEEESWDLHIPSIVNTWKGGCIIRMDLLETIERAARTEEPGLLINKDDIIFMLESCAVHWQRVVSLGHENKVPLPAMSASITYYHTWRASDLPMKLIQAQRDAFGNHGFERNDVPGTFYHEWFGLGNRMN